jgi:hypothetical protein
VFVSAFVSTLIGVPIGIAAAHRPGRTRRCACARPDADAADLVTSSHAMFGLGVSLADFDGVCAASADSIDAPRNFLVPNPLLEAGDAFG